MKIMRENKNGFWIVTTNRSAYPYQYITPVFINNYNDGAVILR